MNREEALDIIRGRVAKGVRFLNKNYPKWYKTIKVRMFDFGDPCKCVIGQVCPPSKALKQRDSYPAFGVAHRREVGVRSEWADYGFDGAFEFSDIDAFNEIRELGVEWTRQIAIAREVAAR